MRVHIERDAVPLSATQKFLAKDVSQVVTLGPEADAAYLAVAAQAALDPEVFKRAKLRVVFTNIHGVGGISSVPMTAFVKPEPGLMVLFPSYLPHMVYVHQGKRPRISIAFNLRKEPFP